VIARDVVRSRPAVAPPVVQLEPVAVALAVASVIELMVLRAFTRTAVHIPALSALQRPYEFISTFGRYSYFVAVVLLLVAFPVAVVALWCRGDFAARMAAAALLLFSFVAVAARSRAVDILVLDALTIGAVVLAAAAVASRGQWRASLVVAAFAAAFALQGTSSFLQDAASQGLASFETRWLLWAAEWLALLFAAAAPLGFAVRPSRWGLVLSIAVAAFTFAVLLANGSTFKVLLLWNEGLAGTLPSAGYAVAAGSLTAAVFGLLQHRRALPAAGLVLLISGGIGLHSTYQTGLVLAGLAVICLAAREPALAAHAKVK